MRYLSLFSGIEAASVAWQPLGWTCVAVAEIEKYPNEALAYHYPTVPNLGDVSRMTEADVAALGQIDLVVFGSPCQDLSVAGKRKGLDGERSGLFFVAMRIVEWARKHCGLRWALWENVPGAFTSAGGADFAAVVEHMVGLECEPPANGWANEGAALGPKGLLEWSTLDAQWFGVAQRRRRCFALADFGNWSGRPPVLLESEGLRGDSAPSRDERKGAAAGTGLSATCSGERVGSWWNGSQVSQTLDAVLHKGQMMPEKNRFPVVLVPGPESCSPATAESASAAANLFAMPAGGTTTSAPALDPLSATSLNTPSETECCIAFPSTLSGTQVAATPDVSCSLGAKTPMAVLIPPMQVRRLTPLECERLQGFPDHYTLIGGAKDSPRYKALGNSMAVPVMRWIGYSIDFSHCHF